MGNFNCRICELSKEDTSHEALVEKKGNQIQIQIGPNFLPHKNRIIRRSSLITEDIKKLQMPAETPKTFEHHNSTSLYDDKISCIIGKYKPSLTIENVFADKNQCLAFYRMKRRNEEIAEIAYVDLDVNTKLVLYDVSHNRKIIDKTVHDDKIYMLKHFFYIEIDRNLLLTTSCDKSIKVFIVNEAELTEHLRLANCHNGFDYNRFSLLIDEGLLFVVGGNKREKIKIWNSKGEKLYQLEESLLLQVNYLEMASIVFPEEENSVIVAGFPCCETYNYTNHDIKVFNDTSVESFNCTCALICTINGINNLICCDKLGIVRVFTYFTKELIKKIDVGMPVLDVAQFNESYLLLSGKLKRLKIIDTKEFSLMFKSNYSHQDFVTNIRVLKDKEGDIIFATSGKDEKIEVWLDK